MKYHRVHERIIICLHSRSNIFGDGHYFTLEFTKQEYVCLLSGHTTFSAELSLATNASENDLEKTLDANHEKACCPPVRQKEKKCPWPQFAVQIL